MRNAEYGKWNGENGGGKLEGGKWSAEVGMLNEEVGRRRSESVANHIKNAA
jgi:hypothetical protein